MPKATRENTPFKKTRYRNPKNIHELSAEVWRLYREVNTLRNSILNGVFDRSCLYGREEEIKEQTGDGWTWLNEVSDTLQDIIDDGDGVRSLYL